MEEEEEEDKEGERGSYLVSPVGVGSQVGGAVLFLNGD